MSHDQIVYYQVLLYVHTEWAGGVEMSVFVCFMMSELTTLVFSISTYT